MFVSILINYTSSKMSAAASLQPQSDLSSYLVFMSDEEDSNNNNSNLPVIKTMQELVQENPHMLMMNPEADTPRCELAWNKFQIDMRNNNHQITLEKPVQVAAAATTETNTTTATKTVFDVKKLHAVAGATIPWQIPLFHQKISQLTVPKWFFFDETTNAEEFREKNLFGQEQLTDLLRRGTLKLPELNAPFETEILGEAGRWLRVKTNRYYHFPPCVRQMNCIGSTLLVNRVKGLTTPMVLMQMLFPEEYQQFIIHGELPPNTPQRPCILCCRYDLGDWITFLRSNRMHQHNTNNTSTPVVDFKNECKQVFQFYRNPKDVEKGYDSRFMLKPQIGEAIVDSIVLLNTSLLECKTLSNGRRRIAQDALFYRGNKEPNPNIGESVQHF